MAVLNSLKHSSIQQLKIQAISSFTLTKKKTMTPLTKIMKTFVVTLH